MTVAITRTEYDAAGLRRLASREADAKVARRLLALALVLEGASRADAASATGMDRQTLRDWVHRYNETGVPGLSHQPHGGGPVPKLSVAERKRLADWVRQGPKLEEDSVVLWHLRPQTAGSGTVLRDPGRAQHRKSAEGDGLQPYLGASTPSQGKWGSPGGA